MQNYKGSIVYSASDLVNSLACAHRSVLDLRNLYTPMEKTPDDDQAKLTQDKGLEHESEYLGHLRDKEWDKITCGKKHFEAIGVDYEVVTTLDEELNG